MSDWLTGHPMDPDAETVEPLPAIPGFPFLHAACSAMIVGPTGAGRSSLMQAALYDAARAGVRCAYLGSEVTRAEFNSRAAWLAERRSDTIDGDLREQLAHVRYLDLAETFGHAWTHAEDWIAAMSERYDIVIIDPLSAVAAALGQDFDKSNAEFVAFHGRLIQPLVTAGAAVSMLENIGHDPDAKARAKGASAKSDRVDLTFSCSVSASPPGLMIKAGKVRSVRAGFQRGDEWLFTKDTQRIEARQRSEHNTPSFRPTGQMQRVSETVERDPGLSKRAIRTAVGGNRGYVDLALELLVSEEYIAVERRGQANLHTSIKPYREPSVATVARPWPDRAPATGQTTVATVAPTLRRGTGHGQDNTTQNGTSVANPNADEELERIGAKFQEANT